MLSTGLRGVKMEQLTVFGRDAHFELVSEGEKDLTDAL
jgi:hypothetical protein